MGDGLLKGTGFCFFFRMMKVFVISGVRGKDRNKSKYILLDGKNYGKKYSE